MSQKLTINQIAEIAQVSKGTVSKILNNREGVGEETRQRVLKIIADLEYTPSASAQALAFNKTFNIGFIFPHLPDDSLSAPYWSSLMTAIAKEAMAHNYSLVLFTPEETGDLTSIFDKIISTKKVDGMILAAEFLNVKHQERLNKANIPFVLIDEGPEGFSSYVDVDNIEATEKLTQHIIEQGFQQIAFIGGPLETAHAKKRLNAFKQISKKNKVFNNSESLKAYTLNEVQRATQKIISKDPLPDALLLGAGGPMLFDVIKFIEKENPAKPLPLFVFDDYPFLDHINPKVTAVRQPFTQKGRIAVEMLLALINNPNQTIEPVILPASLIIR